MAIEFTVPAIGSMRDWTITGNVDLICWSCFSVWIASSKKIEDGIDEIEKSYGITINAQDKIVNINNVDIVNENECDSDDHLENLERIKTISLMFNGTMSI